jgi:hypothetical protein
MNKNGRSESPRFVNKKREISNIKDNNRDFHALSFGPWSLDRGSVVEKRLRYCMGFGGPPDI